MIYRIVCPEVPRGTLHIIEEWENGNVAYKRLSIIQANNRNRYRAVGQLSPLRYRMIILNTPWNEWRSDVKLVRRTRDQAEARIAWRRLSQTFFGPVERLLDRMDAAFLRATYRRWDE